MGPSAQLIMLLSALFVSPRLAFKTTIRIRPTSSGRSWGSVRRATAGKATSLQEVLIQEFTKVDVLERFASDSFHFEFPDRADLVIDGAGSISLPFRANQVASLVAASEQAPFGRGLETVVDLAVRRARQIDASKVHVSDEFNRAVQEAAVWAAEALGVHSRGIEARLYRLNMYEAGGFFLPHKDTEKEPGMFATMLVRLPSSHTGGQLRVAHGGEERILFGDDDDVANPKV